MEIFSNLWLYIKKKLAKLFKLILGMWLFVVNLISFEFHVFLMPIELVFEFKLLLEINNKKII